MKVSSSISENAEVWTLKQANVSTSVMTKSSDRKGTVWNPYLLTPQKQTPIS